MPMNLFAACRDLNGQLIAKRVRLNANVQQAVTALFTQQEADFRDGVIDEIPFDGRWVPDDDEFLTLNVPAEAQIFEDAINGNALAIQDINAAAFSNEGIRALFMGEAVNGATKVLVQRFTAQQILDRRLPLILDGNTFRRLTEPVFTLDNALTCIIENGILKFKSQTKLRSIINMLDIYRAATDQETQDFAAHANLHVPDVAAFVALTNQVTRKLIHAVTNNQTLDNHAPDVIQVAAAQTGLVIDLHNGRIVVPNDARGVKALLQFLNESRYTGPLSGQAYVTNSHRPA